MVIDMGILQVFDLIFYPIEKLIDLLKSQEISNYLFSGTMTLYSFIIVLICIFLVCRFALKPVSLRFGKDSPVQSESDPPLAGGGITERQASDMDLPFANGRLR